MIFIFFAKRRWSGGKKNPCGSWRLRKSFSFLSFFVCFATHSIKTIADWRDEEKSNDEERKERQTPASKPSKVELRNNKNIKNQKEKKQKKRSIQYHHNSSDRWFITNDMASGNEKKMFFPSCLICRRAIDGCLLSSHPVP